MPQLPQPKDLQPFPTLLALRYRGHEGALRCIAPDPTGQWLLTGGEDGTLRLWEVSTARCMRVWQLGGDGGSSGDASSVASRPEPVVAAAWCLIPSIRLVSAAVGRRLVLLPVPIGTEEQRAATGAALDAAMVAASAGGSAGDAPGEGQLAAWRRRQQPGAPKGEPAALELVHRFALRSLAWHARGDYFASVSPDGNTQAVLVHQLSRGVSQNPFRKNRRAP